MYVPDSYREALYAQIIFARELLDDDGNPKPDAIVPPEYGRIRTPITIQHPLRLSRKFYNAMVKKFSKEDLLREPIWGKPPTELMTSTFRSRLVTPPQRPRQETPRSTPSSDEGDEESERDEESDEEEEEREEGGDGEPSSESPSPKHTESKPSKRPGSSQVGDKRPPSSSQSGPPAKRTRGAKQARLKNQVQYTRKKKS
jgi:hypothetical protein